MKRPLKPKTTIEKLNVVKKNVKNWHMLIKDKLIGGSTILYKFHNGIEVECRSKSTDINESVVVLSGIEYPHELCCFSEEIEPVIFDVGANIGSFSLYIHSLNKNNNAHIYAFEPFTSNLKLCESNLTRNGVENAVFIEKAIAGSDGYADFDISGGFDSFHINNEDTDNDSIKIETVRLSTFCNDNSINKIDLLKMDIEGSEFEVVNQDIEFIEIHVDIILMEFHQNKESEKVQNLIQFLESSFDIKLENLHDNGGMIIAERKVRD